VVSGLYAIGQVYIPLQDFFLVRIRPNKPLALMDTNRVVMQKFAGSRKEVKKVSWQRGWAAAKFREFGNFQLLLDEDPPQIRPIGFTNHGNLSKLYQISFAIKDNLDEFRNFRAELDGKWLCFSNDKGKLFTYRFDEHCAPGPHQLKVHVEDEAGNVAEEMYEFSR
jgi:hypothetical protein